MAYEIKRTGVNPFDIMCSDCPVHEIEWWENATLEDLHNAHAEEMEMDAATPDWIAKEIREQGERHLANSDFNGWLREQIERKYVRIVA